MRHTLRIDRQRISAHSCVFTYPHFEAAGAMRIVRLCSALRKQRAVRQRVVFGAIWKEQRIAYCVLTGRGWCLEQFGGSDALRIAYCVLRGGAHCKRSLEGAAHCVLRIAYCVLRGSPQEEFGGSGALRITYCVLRKVTKVGLGCRSLHCSITKVEVWGA